MQNCAKIYKKLTHGVILMGVFADIYDICVFCMR